MLAPLKIVLFAFDGVQILDVTGPASVFTTANEVVGQPCYEVHVVSAEGGMIRSGNAIELSTRAMSDLHIRPIDTLLIAGGEESALRRFADDQKVCRWITQTAAKARRYGSVCTGAFVLAHFGLAAGKRMATHWAACSMLSQHYPDVSVDENALYIEDGRLWTSGGVTTGIDMCLAMVERDWGGAVANAIAKRLVLYVRRPGYQSQFSPMLTAQTQADAIFSDLIDWMASHLMETLDVPQLAARVVMSERSFYRKFTKLIGDTPAHFVETLRLDQVRQLLGTQQSLKQIAAQTGFSSAAKLSQAFERRFGMTPRLFKEIHAGAYRESDVLSSG